MTQTIRRYRNIEDFRTHHPMTERELMHCLVEMRLMFSKQEIHWMPADQSTLEERTYRALVALLPT